MSQSPATEFHRFPDLPFELRQAIWKECLPRRVVPQSNPLPFMPLFACSASTTALRSRLRPPLISRVCCESRKIAIDNRGQWPNPGRPMFPPAWFDVTTDTILIYAHLGPLADKELDLWKRICVVKPRRIVVNFAGYGFSSRSFRQTLVESTLAENRQPADIFLSVMHTIIHARHEDAVRSGLFGRCGEETIVLVDIRDRQTLRKFRELDHAVQALDDHRISKVLDAMDEWDREHGDKDDRGDGAAYILQINLENAWLGSHLYNGRRPADGNLDVLVKSGKTIEHYDRGHPWVREMLQLMPRFKLTVLVELCEHMPHLQ